MSPAVSYVLSGVRADGSRVILAKNIASFAGAVRLQRAAGAMEFKSFLIQSSVLAPATHQAHVDAADSHPHTSLALALNGAFATE